MVNEKIVSDEDKRRACLYALHDARELMPCKCGITWVTRPLSAPSESLARGGRSCEIFVCLCGVPFRLSDREVYMAAEVNR